MADDIKPVDTDLGAETKTGTENTDRPSLSTEHQKAGDARLPSDTLDRSQAAHEETIARKSSLT